MQLWPKLAAWFGLRPGPVLRVPLATYMPHHEGTWERTVHRYGLKKTPYTKVRPATEARSIRSDMPA